MEMLSVVKALSDETRLRMVSILHRAGDLCACELESILGVSQSNASRHLSRLRLAELIVDERRGQWVHYRVNLDAWVSQPYIAAILDAARADLPVLARDIERYSAYRSSGFTCTTIREWAQLPPLDPAASTATMEW